MSTYIPCPLQLDLHNSIGTNRMESEHVKICICYKYIRHFEPEPTMHFGHPIPICRRDMQTARTTYFSGSEIEPKLLIHSLSSISKVILLLVCVCVSVVGSYNLQRTYLQDAGINTCIIMSIL